METKTGPWILALAKLLFGTMAISLQLIPAPVVVMALAMHFFGAVGSFPKAYRDLRKMSWKTIARVAAVSIPIVITDITYFYAVRAMDVSVATLIRWIAPVLLAAGLFFFTKHKSVKVIIATIMGFIGLALVLTGQGISFNSANQLGISLALLSAISVAVFWYSSKQVLRSSTPMVVMFLRSVVACLALIPFVSGWQGANDWWLPLLLFGLSYGFVASYIDIVGLQRTPVQYVGLIGYIVPLTAVLGATLVLGETVTPLMALGGVIIIVSGLWAQRT